MAIIRAIQKPLEDETWRQSPVIQSLQAKDKARFEKALARYQKTIKKKKVS